MTFKIINGKILSKLIHSRVDRLGQSPHVIPSLCSILKELNIQIIAERGSNNG